jgi:hypothetical protein
MFNRNTTNQEVALYPFIHSLEPLSATQLDHSQIYLKGKFTRDTAELRTMGNSQKHGTYGTLVVSMANQNYATIASSCGFVIV